VQQRVLAHHAAHWGIRLSNATDLGDALQAIHAARHEQDPFRIAIADFQDSESDGIEFARQLALDPLGARVQLILLTSLQHRLSAETAREHHVTATVTRPIRQGGLLRALREALALQRGRHSFAPLEGDGTPSGRVPALPGEAGLRILIVEDNPVNQRVAQMQLQKAGHQPDLAANGIAALKALEKQRYDVVFMDCQMPEMDGYETTQRLRNDPRHAGLHIIAMTANAMDGDREKCFAAGMNDYVAKPTRDADLRAALERAQSRLSQSRNR
jgi:CheY-like chemotaxis protein